jgi:hypothetical protein
MRSSHIAYHAADEVNLVAATEVTREPDASLRRFASPDSRAFAAIVHDLDHLDCCCGRGVGGEFLSQTAALPVAEEAPDEPAVLCEMVRALAAHAHRVMRLSPGGAGIDMPGEIGDLKGRISQLQQRVDRNRGQDQRKLKDLQRWLDSLLRSVENFVAQAPREVE